MKITYLYLHQIILVHVSRTWERIRLEQAHKEMPYDNIDSVDNIIEIADNIIEHKVMQKFLDTKINDGEGNWDWEKESGVSCSDTFIENLATELIYSDILSLNNISKEDYIIWDNEKNEPLEDLDIVYHYTSIIELFNDDNFGLKGNEEIRCVAELPIKWQIKINKAIQDNK